MNKEQAASLRKAFPANQIGTLPKGGVRLEYVGHAATTDRLLQVDPDWTWAPVAHDELGLPRLDEHGGLWISLTVCGVTRYGYGDAAGKKGPNAVKEAIGDAIRNAAMRFGVALDLWAKEDLQAGEPAPKKSPRSTSTPPSAAAQQPKPTPGSAAPSGDSELTLPPDQDVINADQVKRLWTIARGELDLTDESVASVVVAITGQQSTRAIPAHLYDKVIEELHTLAAASKL
jgi:hypothetical protein